MAQDTKPSDVPAADPVGVKADQKAHPTDPAHQEHGHPDEALYIKVALILAVITAAEVATYYIEGLQGGALVAILLVMAVIKFALVALFFMHLRFDSPIFMRLFVLGILLAVGVYIAALSTLHVWE
ncbi:MAG: cytochrome C oxidase subunit IV family protein [Actinomycetota bacterium]|nr:cytochrome C oxidase subunit IV family protein [Actinomycetota bacterium]